MSFNRVPEFPQMYLQYLDQARRQTNLGTFQLGGTSGGGGGSGIPPGGFIGQLIQTRVTYDTTEAATTSGSSSLLDNLNHIRSRLNNLEAGGGTGGVTGSGANGRVAFWTSGSMLSSGSTFLWTSATGLLTVPNLSVTSGSMLLAGSTLALDAPIRLDPTGAISGSLLAYNGTKWVVTPPGATGNVGGFGTAGQVAFWTSGSAIGGSAAFTWTTSGSALVLGGGTYVSGLSGSLQIIRQGTAAGQVAIVYSSTASDAPFYTGAHARGTAVSPTATQTGDSLLQINAIGHYGSWATASARIEAVANEGFASGDWGTDWLLSTTREDTNTLYPTLRVNASGLTASVPTAGDGAAFTIAHLDSTDGASSAYLNAIAGGAGGGDAAVGLSIPGATDWSAGIDNDDDDRYKIGASLSVGTNVALTLFADALDTIGIGSNTLKLDNSIELDPTGAFAGVFLSYNGTKWVPTSGSSSLTGFGSTNQVAIWGGPSSLIGDPGLTYDSGDLHLTGNINWDVNDKGFYIVGNGVNPGAGTLRYDASNSWVLTNQAEGASKGNGINFVIYTTAATTPSMIWNEDGDEPERTHLRLVQGTMGSRFTIGGANGDVDIITSGSSGTDIATFPGAITLAGPFTLAGDVLTLGYGSYTAMTGTKDRATAYATGSITLVQLAERVGAMLDDLISSGVLSA